MKSFLCCIAILMMFSGGHCLSESTSCSTVNGKTICEKQKSSGNSAMSSSQSGTGFYGDFQQAEVGAGNGGNYYYSSSSQRGNVPPQAFGPPPPVFAGPFDPFKFAGVPNPMNMFGGGFGGGAFAFAGRR